MEVAQTTKPRRLLAHDRIDHRLLAFEAADRAYLAAWGHKPLHIGVGGSIPFVALFGRRFKDLPLILNGVMDPQTTAHGPNESLHLGVFHKAMLANVHLLDELADAVTVHKR